MKSCNIPREVVRFLGAFSIIGLVGIFSLLGLDKAVPSEVIILVAGTASALGAILSSTRNVNEPQAVEVMNEKKDPLPVEEVKEEDTGR